MSIFSKGLVAAMEQEAEDTVLAIDEAGADSAEADLVEATDISADVEAGVQEVDQAMADADTLERIAGAAEEANADGGLDPVAAEIAEIAVEAIYSRLGISISNTSYPALESFSGRSSRGRATSLAIESIGETLKKIWAAIVNAFQKIIDFITNFFAKIFDSTRKLSSRINNLNRRNQEATEDYGGKVKSNGIIKGLRGKDKKELISNAKNASDELGAGIVWSIQASSNLGKITKELQTVLTYAERTEDGEKAGSLDKAKTIQDYYKSVTDLKTVTVGKQVIGPTIEIKEANAVSGIREMWESLGSFSISVVEALPFTEVDEIEALNRKEVSIILENAKTLVDGLVGKKAALASVTANIKLAVEGAKRNAEIAPKDDDNKVIAEESRIAARAIQVAGSTITKFVTTYTKLGANAAKAAIDYAERSMANGPDKSGDKKDKK